MQGLWAQYLTGELRNQMLNGLAKRKKNVFKKILKILKQKVSLESV